MMFRFLLLSGYGAGTLTAKLMPWPDGVPARKTGPFATPWRTVLMGDNAAVLVESGSGRTSAGPPVGGLQTAEGQTFGSLV